MPEQRQQYINIDECVLAYLDESEQNKSSRYFKCWQLAYRGAAELGLDVFYSPKTVELPVNANGTVGIPSDCILPYLLGVGNFAGEIVPFRKDGDMSSFGSLSGNRIAAVTDTTLVGVYSSNPSTLGIGGRLSAGDVTVDEANNIIILKTMVSGNIFLVYLASPSEEEACYIPIQFKEALIAYIGWKDIRFLPSSRRGNGGDKMQRRRDYYNERRLAKARYKPFILQEATDKY